MLLRNHNIPSMSQVVLNNVDKFPAFHPTLGLTACFLFPNHSSYNSSFKSTNALSRAYISRLVQINSLCPVPQRSSNFEMVLPCWIPRFLGCCLRQFPRPLIDKRFGLLQFILKYARRLKMYLPLNAGNINLVVAFNSVLELVVRSILNRHWI